MEHEHNHEHEENECGLKSIIIAAVFLVLGIVAGKIELNISNQISEAITMCFYIVAYLLVGKSVVLEALHNIFKGDVFDEHFLMTVASVGAVFIGEYPEAVAVMLFYQIGEFFQDYAVDKSTESIEELLKIRPDKATVLRNGEKIEVQADEVEIGESVFVAPGERIPVDGIVLKGKTYVNNSSLTGESVPVEVYEGSAVSSGAINTESLIEVKAVKKSEDSCAARIIKMVQTSSEKKSKSERFITRFSKVYTPIVCIFAVCVAILPPSFINTFKPEDFTAELWSTWIYRALIFLVVSCPCAIVISIPLTFFCGIGEASKCGILIKNSSTVDFLSKVKTVAFDKTGTLTKGVFEVREIHNANKDKYSDEELISILTHAESYSNHPVSKSLKLIHHGECCSNVNISSTKEISGEGVVVFVDGKTVIAGNDKLMKNQGVSNFTECPLDDEGTVVHIAVDSEYCGHIIISDEIKESSKQAIVELKKQAVRKTVILSGDNQKACDKVMNKLNVDLCYAQLTPEGKVQKIEELIEEERKSGNGGRVLFAGDGINDSPVLARSDVGVAMGALGSDAAIETADVVIMNDDLLKVVEAVSISKKTILIAKENIIFSLLIKVLIMLFSAFGFVNMWIAVFGDTGIALLAVLNSIRRKK